MNCRSGCFTLDAPLRVALHEDLGVHHDARRVDAALLHVRDHRVHVAQLKPHVHRVGRDGLGIELQEFAVLRRKGVDVPVAREAGLLAVGSQCAATAAIALLLLRSAEAAASSSCPPG